MSSVDVLKTRLPHRAPRRCSVTARRPSDELQHRPFTYEPEAWCKWLIITGRRADDPTRPVADEHLARLLDTRMYRRTRAMILLAAYARLRVSEIAAIKGDDVDTVINTITVIGEGDKERQIPLDPILRDLAAVMPPRGWWFPTYIGNTKHMAGGPMLATPSAPASPTS